MTTEACPGQPASAAEAQAAERRPRVTVASAGWAPANTKPPGGQRNGQVPALVFWFAALGAADVMSDVLGAAYATHWGAMRTAEFKFRLGLGLVFLGLHGAACAWAAKAWAEMKARPEPSPTMAGKPPAGRGPPVAAGPVSWAPVLSAATGWAKVRVGGSYLLMLVGLFGVRNASRALSLATSGKWDDAGHHLLWAWGQVIVGCWGWYLWTGEAMKQRWWRPAKFGGPPPA